jgi:hypothetical protein
VAPAPPSPKFSSNFLGRCAGRVNDLLPTVFRPMSPDLGHDLALSTGNLALTRAFLLRAGQNVCTNLEPRAADLTAERRGASGAQGRSALDGRVDGPGGTRREVEARTQICRRQPAMTTGALSSTSSQLCRRPGAHCRRPAVQTSDTPIARAEAQITQRQPVIAEERGRVCALTWPKSGLNRHIHFDDCIASQWGSSHLSVVTQRVNGFTPRVGRRW